MKTYINRKSGIVKFVSELIHLYRFQSKNQASQVQDLVFNMRQMENSIESLLGSKVQNKNILEVGPGQKMPHLYYFARKNSYVGIDLDQPIQDISVKGTIDMWRSNGLTRVVKTLGRRLLGIDRSFKSELFKQLNIEKKPASRLLQMDATDLQFDNNTFDIVFSISVFEHIPDPKDVAREIARVLKPGGVSYIVTHPYTSDSGIHDPRVFGEHEGIPYWSHLRPEYVNLVSRNCYLNEIPLEQYVNMFNEVWPNCEHEYVSNSETAEEELLNIRQKGELKDYSDKELMTDALISTWRKH